MLKKLGQWFQSTPKEDPEQQFCQQHGLVFDPEQGIVLHGQVLSSMNESLHYLSNRRVNDVNQLQAVYEAGMIIHEKIDLELATGRFVTRLGHDAARLQEIKQAVRVLEQYYRQFKRDVR